MTNSDVANKMDTVFDPVKFIRDAAEKLNAKAGNLGGYDCPKCLNRGYAAFQREDGKIALRECECLPTRAHILDLMDEG